MYGHGHTGTQCIICCIRHHLIFGLQCINTGVFLEMGLPIPKMLGLREGKMGAGSMNRSGVFVGLFGRASSDSNSLRKRIL
jgi:hypothetical protein